MQVRRKSSVTKRSHSPAVRAPPGKLSADFIQRHAANVSEKIKAGNRSLLPRARGPRATSLEKENLKSITDMNAREIAVLAPLIILTILFGFYPAPILDAMDVSVEQLAEHYQTSLAAMKQAAQVAAAQ